MATDGRSLAIIDTSVLVNFLAIDRTDLLASHPAHRFLVVDLVRDEVIKRAQVDRFQAALAAGELLPDGPPETIRMEELAAFATLSGLNALGLGEQAAAAAAYARNLPLFMDDRRAWKRLATEFPGIVRGDTVSLIVSLIKANVLDVAQADAIKDTWASNHSFRLKFASFAEVV
jgi:predicted nucleic acid-binding protein